MEEVIEILKEVVSNDSINFESEENLVESGILDSLTLVKIIMKVKDKFNVSIPVEEITPKNFKNVNSILKMIEKLKKNI